MNKPKETFKEAAERIQRELVGYGWKSSQPGLKVMHFTSPDGQTRLWFKTQSIYMSNLTPRFKNHNLAGALSLHMDPRVSKAEQVVLRAEALTKARVEGDY